MWLNWGPGEMLSSFVHIATLPPVRWNEHFRSLSNTSYYSLPEFCPDIWEFIADSNAARACVCDKDPTILGSHLAVLILNANQQFTQSFDDWSWSWNSEHMKGSWSISLSTFVVMMIPYLSLITWHKSTDSWKRVEACWLSFVIIWTRTTVKWLMKPSQTNWSCMLVS